MPEITYSWDVRPNMGVTYNQGNLQNVVNWVKWEYKAEYGSVYKVMNDIITFPQPSDNTFIPFENLTKQTIITWVEENLGQEYITNMQQKLSSSIAQETQPSTGILSAPWL